MPIPSPTSAGPATTSAFGPKLKRYREARHVSQSRLALRAGFDHSYVSRIESGTRTPSRDAVVQLANALGLEQGDRDELLAAAGFMPGDVVSLLSEEPELTDVLNVLRNADLSPGYRETVRSVLRSLAQQARVVAGVAK